METDSEINVASPAPEITRRLREDLWRLHTRKKPDKNMKKEFKIWEKVMAKNKQNKKKKKQLQGFLIEFFLDKHSNIAFD